MASPDFNTAGFSYRISTLNTIDFHSDRIVVQYAVYPELRMNGVLRKVARQLTEPLTTRHDGPRAVVPRNELPSPDPTITHAWLWPRVGRWLRTDDVLVTETGTANFGIWNTRFPRGVKALSQVLWGSIGWSVGACQGAALAARELGRPRTILFVGDGSLQLGVQEISTMLRRELTPIMYVTSIFVNFFAFVTEMLTAAPPPSDS